MKQVLMAALVAMVLGCGVDDKSSGGGSSAAMVIPCDSVVGYVLDGDTIETLGWDSRVTDEACPQWQTVIWSCASYPEYGPECYDATFVFVNDCNDTGWYLSGGPIEISNCE